MHVLGGESALRALRAVRCRQLSVRLPLPEVEPPVVSLPGQEQKAPEPSQEEWWCGPTLADEGFPFGSAETNGSVDLHRLGDVGKFTREAPLELMVFDYAHRTTRKKTRTRVLSQEVPARALVCVDPTLYFACPELVVLQMSARLGPVALAQLIMELCGSYSLAPDPDGREGATFDIPPVTTIDRIRSCAKHVRARGGTTTLGWALRYALERSASPGETTLALMMSLPPEEGGYGFGVPVLNGRVDVPANLEACVAGGPFYPDVFLQGGYVDLEYQSTEFHLDPLAVASLTMVREGLETADPELAAWRRDFIAKGDSDLRRTRDLQLLGLHVVPVTGFDLREPERMDQVACAVARHLAGEGLLDWEPWHASLEARDYRELRAHLLRSCLPLSPKKTAP